MFIADKSAEFFPHSPPDKTTFIVHDFTRPWPDVLLGTFDVVHQRLALLAQGPSLRSVIAGLGSLLKSNGWIQFVEMDNLPVSSNGTAWHQTAFLMREVCALMGGTPNFNQLLPDLLKAEGFETIQTKQIVAGMGMRNDHPEHGEVQVEALHSFVGAVCESLRGESILRASI